MQETQNLDSEMVISGDLETLNVQNFLTPSILKTFLRPWYRSENKPFQKNSPFTIKKYTKHSKCSSIYSPPFRDISYV
jgi:hypothetical protein